MTDEELAELAGFDRQNRAIDATLWRRRAEAARVAQEQTLSADQISALIDARIEQAKDQLIDTIGDELGLFLKEIDVQIKDVINRVTDAEVQLRHLLTARADLRDERTKFELDGMKEVLNTIVTKIAAVRSGEVMPIRRLNS